MGALSKIKEICNNSDCGSCVLKPVVCCLIVSIDPSEWDLELIEEVLKKN